MPKCGDFGHDLIDSGGQSGWSNVVLIRCTIVAIDPWYNTASVLVGADPPDGVPLNELTDIDCPQIPAFNGDTFAGDRRQFNQVPIYYHCQGSTGTVEELRTGHTAFRVPTVELTNPPYTQQEVDENHTNIIREKALLLYIPPTKEEEDAGIPGYRYIIGHTDRNDIAPCKSEYICMRMTRKYDLTRWVPDGFGGEIYNENYGYALEPDACIVHIVDPIGRRAYRGLEDWGITFPCAASDITDKVQSITIDENTPLDDIAFLDKLYTIDALYDQSFILQPPYQSLNDYVIPGGNTEQYAPTPNCHTWYPVKLCWLTHFFDQGLQCEILSLDPRTFYEPWGVMGIFHYNNSLDLKNYAMYNNRTYKQWPNGDYEAEFDIVGPFPTYLPDFYERTENVLWISTGTAAQNNRYFHGITEFERNNSVEIKNLRGWYVTGDTDNYLEMPFMMVNYFHRYDSEWSDANGVTIDYHEIKIDLSFYHPSSNDPWHTVTLESSVNFDVYDGFPISGYTPSSGSGFAGEGCNGEAMCVGLKGTYSFHVAIYFHGGMAFTNGSLDVDNYTLDLTQSTVKVNLSYNPAFWKGQDACAAYRRTPSALEHLPGASEFCEQEMRKVWDLFVPACAPYHYYTLTGGGQLPAFPNGVFSAFTVTVVE